MDRTNSNNKLADLKLVSKHYPVSNFSYPRPDAHAHAHSHHHHHYYYQNGRPPRWVGRSSVGSDCSAPGMVDDHESDISAEDDYQYHISGAELWDSFWQAKPPDAAPPAKTAKYPALIPSPAVVRRRRADVPIKEEEDELPCGSGTTTPFSNGQEPPSWPLPLNPLSPENAAAAARCPKAIAIAAAAAAASASSATAYSLFPAPLKTPSRPSHPPRTSSMSQLRPPPDQHLSRPPRASNLSLPSVPRPRPAPIDFKQPGWATTTTTTTTTRSAPTTPWFPTSPPIGPAEPTPPQPTVKRTLSKAKSHAALQSSSSSSSSSSSINLPRTRIARSASTANFRPVTDLSSNPLAGRTIKSAPPTVTAFELLRPSRPAPKPPVVSVFDSDTDDDDDRTVAPDAHLARRLLARAAQHRRSASEGKKAAAATAAAASSSSAAGTAGHSKLVKHSRARADTAAAALLPPGGAAFEVHRVVQGPAMGVRRQPSLGFQRVLGRWSH